MLKNKYLRIVLGLACFAAAAWILIPQILYYDPGEAFRYNAVNPTGYNEIIVNNTLDLIFDNQTEDSDSNAVVLNFTSNKDGLPWAFTIPTESIGAPPLVPGQSCTVTYAISDPEVPFYVLLIYHQDELVYGGIADTQFERRFQQAGYNLPFSIEQTDILDLHKSGGGRCYASMVNAEYTFTLPDGESLKLNQGQSGKLGDYRITLPIARITDYGDKQCAGFVPVEISWTATLID